MKLYLSYKVSIKIFMNYKNTVFRVL